MSTHSLQKKWNNIYQQAEGEPHIAEVLQHNHYLLPTEGVALDLACGRGGNALLMAEKGLSVKAWDISEVAIDALIARALGSGLTIDAQVRDVVKNPPEPNSLDVLFVSHFLSRSLCPALYEAIKPGGLLMYQTFCEQKVNDSGPSNPDYLLTDNELLSLFAGMKVRVYREEALLGEHNVGMRNQAWLFAEKR